MKQNLQRLTRGRYEYVYNTGHERKLLKVTATLFRFIFHIIQFNRRHTFIVKETACMWRKLLQRSSL